MIKKTNYKRKLSESLVFKYWDFGFVSNFEISI